MIGECMMRNFLRSTLAVRMVPVVGILLGGCAVPRGTDGGSSEVVRPQSLFGSLGGAGVSAENPAPENRASENSLSNARTRKPVRPAVQSEIQPPVERSMPMQKVGANTWRTNFSAGVAYQALTRVLSQSYVLASNNKKQMKLSTQWDKFLIDGRLFRNRVEVSVFPVTARSTEVVIQNVVQAYEGDNSVNLIDSNWIGTPDVTNEVQRIVGAFVRQSTSYAKR
jgi:hypothetical protein